MKFAFQADPGDRLLCHLEDADGAHLISSAAAGSAQAELIAALEDLESSPSAECYWQDDACDYRWVFKREGEHLKLAILRLTGVCPGYQHVAWTEEESTPLLASIRTALQSVSPAP
jgi:hypothetical protein